MNSGNFTNTPTHMVQHVKNIVGGYKMGALRALAQEPVQNALDAKRKGEGIVKVEYRLLRRTNSNGESCELLTVTDRGTTGLQGPMVGADELQARNYQLKPVENWAAFEAQGYTKEKEDTLGSRGQGKAAFLYHSHVPGDTRRMVMLYDTLLESGEYRFGMRYARPVDQVMTPPLFNDEAREQVTRERVQFEALDIPLGLAPLAEVGTRVIVPFLANDELQDLRPGGELPCWLQRCWWRAIQLGRLRIRVVDDGSGEKTDIVVPRWWRDLPRDKGKPVQSGRWHDLIDGGRLCVWGDLPLNDGHKIRRLVLAHNDAWKDDEITAEPEWNGVQLLRGSQWIETLGARAEYGDLIPPDMRPGIRGFVEFTKETDTELRKEANENSQHDGFNRRRKIVRDIRDHLNDRVSEFSHNMGWETVSTIESQQVPRRDMTTHSRFLATFLKPKSRKANASSTKGDQEGSQLLWECRLDLDYPDPASSRVDWGQSIRRLYVEVSFEPGEELLGSADLILEWVDAAGKAHKLCSQDDSLWESYIRRLEQLGNGVEPPIEFARAWRQAVATMLEIFAQEND